MRSTNASGIVSRLIVLPVDVLPTVRRPSINVSVRVDPRLRSEIVDCPLLCVLDWLLSLVIEPEIAGNSANASLSSLTPAISRSRALNV